MEYRLCPSILSADFNRLGEQIKILEKEGVEYLHIDVMDGDFVPSISFGMPVIKSIRKESNMFFDVHLMVTEPERYIRDFVECGADSITVHAEACEDLERTLEQIKAAGVKAAVSIKPSTPVNDISHLLEDVDMVLVMTVQPGFGGQKYMAFVVKASPAIVVCCLNADQIFKCVPAFLKCNYGHWIKTMTNIS